MIYLAAPYTHDEPEMREHRFLMANKVASILMRKGKLVFSPITHGHPIIQEGSLSTSWAYWEKHGSYMLSLCSKLVVICAGGWEESVGVRGEIKVAEELGIPIEKHPFLEFF